MSFLQPILLAALPAVLLPVIIHLINQRRYQTIEWGAMMFLLAANRMSRGYARLRQWLILLFRMLAIAGLIFAVSRPLASGWLGLAAGGRADTTLVLLDRSPSMGQRDAAGSKLETGRLQLARSLEILGSARWVLIDSATAAPREIESPREIPNLPSTEAASSSADLPALLEAARGYIEANRPGRTEIWICSDLRENDWNAGDGRWRPLRDSFLNFPQGVRFHLLAYPEAAPENVSIGVTGVRRRDTADGAELLVSLRLSREGRDGGGGKAIVPVTFEIEGARSEVTVEMGGPRFELKDHRIPIDRSRERGWGKVSVPADANPADDEYYFVFDRPAERRTAVVAEDPETARVLGLAASSPPDPESPCAAEFVAPDGVPSIEWEKLSLVLWEAPLPTGETARRAGAFVDRGGVIIFFPPKGPTPDPFAGIRWGAWKESPEGFPVATWRGDGDLLGNTGSGAALPVGALEVRRHCGLSGELTPLASLAGGVPLLGRAASERGGIYFCATTPARGDSSLGRNGIVLYACVQRAIAAGARSLGRTRQVVAGDPSIPSIAPVASWRRLAGPEGAISIEYPFISGIYEAGEKLFAINRSDAEDLAPVLDDARVTALFRGLDFARVDDRAGNLASLIQEIWRPFLAAMIAAMILEAILCLPKVKVEAGTPAPVGP